MFKRKCPRCGTKNNKERMVCIECGVPFAFERVERQLAHVPANRKGTKDKIDYTHGLDKIFYLMGKIIGYLEKKLIDESPTLNKEKKTHNDQHRERHFWAG